MRLEIASSHFHNTSCEIWKPRLKLVYNTSVAISVLFFVIGAKYYILNFDICEEWLTTRLLFRGNAKKVAQWQSHQCMCHTLARTSVWMGACVVDSCLCKNQLFTISVFTLFTCYLTELWKLIRHKFRLAFSNYVQWCKVFVPAQMKSKWVPLSIVFIFWSCFLTKFSMK